MMLYPQNIYTAKAVSRSHICTKSLHYCQQPNETGHVDKKSKPLFHQIPRRLFIRVNLYRIKALLPRRTRVANLLCGYRKTKLNAVSVKLSDSGAAKP